MKNNSDKRCPITYEIIHSDQRYSNRGLHQLAPQLTDLLPLPLSAEELRQEARNRADKMSIQGIQAKLSAIIDVKNNSFKIVDREGTYILKPPSDLYPEVPQNEDLTMRLAKTVNIPVPLHGLLFNADQTFTYFIKRFDRGPRHRKYACEDFAQLSGHTRDTKYNSSMESIAKIIERFCTFPEVEKKALLIRILFNYLVGNEDMHLKNFSLLTINNKIQLSPAYDFLNSTIALGNAREEMALPLHGKKQQITRKDIFNYYAQDCLNLNEKVVQGIIKNFQAQFPTWKSFIDASWLSAAMKNSYEKLLSQRINHLQL